MRYLLPISLVSIALLCGSCIRGEVSQSKSNTVESSFYQSPTASDRKSVSTSEDKKSVSNDDTDDKGDAIFSHTTNKGTLYRHENYSFSYSEEDEQAEWVAYELTKEETYGKQERKEKFVSDPIVVTESSHPYEYRNSGYTRGHLAPAGDMKFDETAMAECFYTSNISPQTREFNAGIWNDLEMKTRNWARKYKKVYVITGPILTDKGLKKMDYENNRGKKEKSDITIPKRFYKIIYDFSYAGKEKMIAFIISQDAEGDLADYVTTVDEVEEATGLDFFTNLSKSEQNELESSSDLSKWAKSQSAY